MFTYAEGFEIPNYQGYDMWFDDIRFEKLDGITNPRPFMPSQTKQYFVGSTANMTGTTTTFDVDGLDIEVEHSPNYFDFKSSDTSVAVVQGNEIKVVGAGDATVTATLDGADVDGSVILSGSTPPAGPAPAADLRTSDVVSLYSDVYGTNPGIVWNTYWQWSTAEDGDYVIDGDNMKSYSFLNFVGIDFKSNTIDATGMTHFHMDVFAPEGTNFKILLISYDANGLGAGQTELTFDATTTPSFASGAWSSLDIPVEDFTGITNWSYIGQLVISTDDAALVLVDNIYWHK